MIGRSISNDRLLKPIGQTSPAGTNIRLSDESKYLYYKLKDARSAARSEERNLVPGEPIRLSASWTEVRTLAREALETVTKDVEILAWLAEAELRLGGFAGLGDVFRATAGLVQERWDELFSIDGDGDEDKVAPFAGLNGVSGEGALIQPLRLTPLAPDAAFFTLSLWDFQTSQRPGEEKRRQALRDAVSAAGPSAMQAHLGAATECLDAFGALTAAFDARCGAHSPPSSNIRGVLEEVRLAIFNLTGLSDGAVRLRVVEKAAPSEAAARPGAPDAEAPAAPAVPAPPREIETREEAFGELLKVAEFFRRTEPHSPISLAIETLVTRGRMDFVSLLTELLPDPNARKAVLMSAGIQPHGDGSN